jgi:hypothetical protein
MQTEILVPLGAFAMVYGIVALSIRRRERMALLEHKMDASVFNSEKKCFSSLKYGLLFFFVGIGLLIANSLVAYGIMDSDVAFFSMAFLFGGVALIADFFIERFKRHEQKNS